MEALRMLLRSPVPGNGFFSRPVTPAPFLSPKEVMEEIVERDIAEKHVEFKAYDAAVEKCRKEMSAVVSYKMLSSTLDLKPGVTSSTSSDISRKKLKA